MASGGRRSPGLVDEFVVLKGLHREQREVHAAREVALEDGIAHMPAPHRQPLALALLEIAPAWAGPPDVVDDAQQPTLLT
jgi:hypothetical protein